MAKKKNTGDAMDTSMEETQGTEEQQQQPEGTEDQTQGKEEQTEGADAGAQNDNTSPEADGGAGQEDAGMPNTESAEHAGTEDKAAEDDELDADMAAEVVAVQSLYAELTGGSKMPINYSMAKVVRDAWATKKPGKPYPGYLAALKTLTGCEV